MEEYRMSLVISLVPKLKGDEGIDRDELWACRSFIIIIKVCRRMELCME